jgi:hypothetical protein
MRHDAGDFARIDAAQAPADETQLAAVAGALGLDHGSESIQPVRQAAARPAVQAEAPVDAVEAGVGKRRAQAKGAPGARSEAGIDDDPVAVAAGRGIPRCPRGQKVDEGSRRLGSEQGEGGRSGIERERRQHR